MTQERTQQIADVKYRNGQVTELDVQQALTILNRTKASNSAAADQPEPGSQYA